MVSYVGFIKDADGDITVSILIVVEDGLVLVFMSKIRFLRICLNPCYSGRWSRTDEMFNEFIRDWAS